VNDEHQIFGGNVEGPKMRIELPIEKLEKDFETL
jgi:hypothetical protein